MPERARDVIIVGSGPNGLAAAIALARTGRSVLVVDAEESLGGGTRSVELTLPGFLHDACSAFHPLAVASPFFRTLPLEQFGLDFVQPPAPLAHPFDDGSAAVLERSVKATGEWLGRDAAAYRALMEPLVRDASRKIADALAAYLRSLGGEFATGTRVQSLDSLPPARAILFDVTPRQLLGIAGHRLPAGYRRKLGGYRYGPGVFKVDWALDGPIPWKAKECARAGTVHLGGTLAEIAASERAAWEGRP